MKSSGRFIWRDFFWLPWLICFASQTIEIPFGLRIEANNTRFTLHTSPLFYLLFLFVRSINFHITLLLHNNETMLRPKMMEMVKSDPETIILFLWIKSITILRVDGLAAAAIFFTYKMKIWNVRSQFCTKWSGITAFFSHDFMMSWRSLDLFIENCESILLSNQQQYRSSRSVLAKSSIQFVNRI